MANGRFFPIIHPAASMLYFPYSSEVIMNVIDILETAQYVVDKRGQQTAVLLDLSSWRMLQQLLEELAEDERLGELMVAVQNDEKFEGQTAQEVYKAFLLEIE